SYSFFRRTAIKRRFDSTARVAFRPPWSILFCPKTTSVPALLTQAPAATGEVLFGTGKAGGLELPDPASPRARRIVTTHAKNTKSPIMLQIELYPKANPSPRTAALEAIVTHRKMTAEPVLGLAKLRQQAAGNKPSPMM